MTIQGIAKRYTYPLGVQQPQADAKLKGWQSYALQTILAIAGAGAGYCVVSNRNLNLMRTVALIGGLVDAVDPAVERTVDSQGNVNKDGRPTTLGLLHAKPFVRWVSLVTMGGLMQRFQNLGATGLKALDWKSLLCVVPVFLAINFDTNAAIISKSSRFPD